MNCILEVCGWGLICLWNDSCCCELYREDCWKLHLSLGGGDGNSGYRVLDKEVTIDGPLILSLTSTCAGGSDRLDLFAQSLGTRVIALVNLNLERISGFDDVGIDHIHECQRDSIC